MSKNPTLKDLFLKGRGEANTFGNVTKLVVLYIAHIVLCVALYIEILLKNFSNYFFCALATGSCSIALCSISASSHSFVCKKPKTEAVSVFAQGTWYLTEKPELQHPIANAPLSLDIVKPSKCTFPLFMCSG